MIFCNIFLIILGMCFVVYAGLVLFKSKRMGAMECMSLASAVVAASCLFGLVGINYGF